MIATPYNTALAHGPDLAELRAELEGVEQARTARGMVFCHAVERPLTPLRASIIQNRVGCVFSVLAWPAGRYLFHQRAERTAQGSYGAYIDGIERLIDRLAKPAFICCPGKVAERLSHCPIRQIRIEGGELVHLAARHVTSIPEGEDTATFLVNLAQRYRSVYDFCCGYGNSLLPFSYSVGSDIDKKCLAYIAREILGWQKSPSLQTS